MSMGLKALSLCVFLAFFGLQAQQLHFQKIVPKRDTILLDYRPILPLSIQYTLFPNLSAPHFNTQQKTLIFSIRPDSLWLN